MARRLPDCADMAEFIKLLVIALLLTFFVADCANVNRNQSNRKSEGLMAKHNGFLTWFGILPQDLFAGVDTKEPATGSSIASKPKVGVTRFKTTSNELPGGNSDDKHDHHHDHENPYVSHFDPDRSADTPFTPITKQPPKTPSKGDRQQPIHQHQPSPPQQPTQNPQQPTNQRPPPFLIEKPLQPTQPQQARRPAPQLPQQQQPQIIPSQQSPKPLPNRPFPPRQGQAGSGQVASDLGNGMVAQNPRPNVQARPLQLYYHPQYYNAAGYRRPFPRPMFRRPNVVANNNSSDASKSSYVDVKDQSSIRDTKTTYQGRQPSFYVPRLRGRPFMHSSPYYARPFHPAFQQTPFRRPNVTVNANETKSELPARLHVRPFGCGPAFGTIPGTCVQMKSTCPGHSKTIGICAVKDHSYKCCSNVPKNVQSLPKAVSYPGLRCKTPDTGETGICRNFNQGCGEDRTASALCGGIANRHLCCVKKSVP